MPITAEGLEVRRSGRIILDVPRLAIDARPTLLVGANGAGKSTLFSALSGRINPTRGRVASDERVVLVQQAFRPIIGFTSAEYCAYVAWLSGREKSAARKESLDWLNFVGLGRVSEQRCETLSGGERSRLAIATALNSGATALLLDEPSAALDPLSKQKITDIYRRIGDQEHTLVVSSHDAGDFGPPFTRVIVLDRGRIQFDGNPEEFLRLAEESGDSPTHALSRSFARRRDGHAT